MSVKGKNNSSSCYHITLSTSELQDIYVLQECLSANKKTQYIIAEELGSKGTNPHVDAYVQFPESRRQDSVRRSVLSSFPDIPPEEKVNCKFLINTLDSNPKYGIGYSVKEHIVDGKLNKDGILTTYSDNELFVAYEYYCSNVKNVEEQKAKLALSYQNSSRISLDRIIDDFLKHCQDQGYYSIDDTNLTTFLQIYPKIPFSIYQKINHEKLVEYVNVYLGV